ncbi:hypothetical protein FVEG_12339 [Fusarium verticillioides 7600]|uniref:Uncharacterized protein n=1 Tax=Gibberella moniliformis (strain M3125 / FGSC 7600) TaxID=334819 RepID=W7MSF5_GIBM7|nr:hypothetical protein FVEG_12339 [Fusarium verticillioides 7600]EWG54036.1 hypothetical protein FVEG_12339 [Fusarium verticillioides 7600]
MSSSPFLSLPPELRHMIYKYYYTTAEGYFLQPISRKLVAADRKPIDLALIYTCRLIAYETRNLPLLYNNITVSTVYDPKLRPWAGRFDYLLFAQFQKQVSLVLILGNWFLTEEMWVRIEQTFPWFVPQLRDALHQHRHGSHRIDLTRFTDWGLSNSFNYSAAPFVRKSYGLSALCEALEFTLRALAQGRTEKFDTIVEYELLDWEYYGSDRLLNFLDKCFKPWDVPHTDVLAEMGRKFGDDHLWPTLGAWEPNRFHTREHRTKFRISAASAAIGWLNKLPANKRICIRDMVIVEDYPSVGRQECHAAGLVPFCRENPQLRINHRVSMLSVIFSRALLIRAGSFGSLANYAEHEIGAEAFDQANQVSFYEIAEWLAEIVSLPKAGMPNESYTFTLDGEPMAFICSRIFQQIVLRKEAMRLTIERRLPSLDPEERDYMGSYLHRGHGNAFAQLIDNSSFVKTNFDPGQLWNAEKMLAEFRRIGPWDFFRNYKGLRMLYELPRPPSVHIIPRLGAVAMENYEVRPCARRRFAQECHHRRLRDSR